MDGSDTEELSQHSLGMLNPYLLEACGSKTVKTANEGGFDEGDVMSVQQEPGVWGQNGLLEVPDVKMVIFLVFVVQVRQKRVQPH